MQKEYFLYSLKNTVNGKMYIGITGNPYQREQMHRTYLNKGFHASDNMIIDYKKHGAKAFVFEVIAEFKTKGEAAKKEKEFIRFYEKKPEGIYNLRLKGTVK